MAAFDPRRTPARPDLAAAHLAGVVEAPRFAEGLAHQVSASVAPLRDAPTPDAEQATQLLFGQTFTVYDIADGRAWGQSLIDGYVGYVDIEALSAPVVAATHSVTALRTYVFSRPSIKSAPLRLISLNARVAAEDFEGRFARIARGGFVIAAHIAPVGSVCKDWVATAEQFLHAPYLWGGSESLGVDCSGLVQNALHAAGIACPRDSDMQADELGAPIAVDLDALQRGDIVCWRGHIGIMLDGARLLHANAHHMATAIEPLRTAVARIEPIAGPIRQIRRLRA